MSLFEVDVDFAQAHPDLHLGRYVQLSVSDTGHGMDAATMERIFDPFFTTKAVGEGTGLGLAVVLGIMQSHDGAITVYSQPGEGTRFNLYFPLLESAVPSHDTSHLPLPRGNGERILFVDDEISLANVGKKMLERLGYGVTMTTSPVEALAILREQPDAFDLVVTDMTMPVMDGVRLGSQMLQIQPRLALVLTTGYSGVITAENVRELGFRELLIKPCTARVLSEAVQRALYPSAVGAGVPPAKV
jgi:CheY-like chemotaxis protein